MKRCFDTIISVLLLVLSSPLLIFLSLLIKFTSEGPIFHISKRIGKENGIFDMLKFRTMKTDAPQLATHLMTDSGQYMTPVGGFLRRTSLDELPQLINVLKGEMSLVGPRPALFNQDDQIALRTKSGCHVLTPGITGWAQTHGRDDISIPEKVELDEYYLKNKSFRLDMKVLWLTAVNVLRKKNVSH